MCPILLTRTMCNNFDSARSAKKLNLFRRSSRPFAGPVSPRRRLAKSLEAVATRFKGECNRPKTKIPEEPSSSGIIHVGNEKLAQT